MIVRGNKVVKRKVSDEIKYCKCSYNPYKPFAFYASKKENKKQHRK
jgi:hypothetical protein